MPNLHRFMTIQGCPVFADIGAYIAIVCNDAHAHINSIYRGEDAADILHKHGKSTQRELWENLPSGQANPPGFSTHELCSDGRAYPSIPRGGRTPWWCQGFDVNDGDVRSVIAQAASHGWHLWRPYPGGTEFHHLNFMRQPSPTPTTLARLWRIRKTYPRS